MKRGCFFPALAISLTDLIILNESVLLNSGNDVNDKYIVIRRGVIRLLSHNCLQGILEQCVVPVSFPETLK